MRNYTIVDLLRFNRLANENKDLKPIELIKLYNEKHPEKTAKEKLINLSRAIGINGLHKYLTGNDIPEDERWEHDENTVLSDSSLPRKSLATHRCPVCNGNGLVPNGFYMQTSGHWSTSSIAAEMCRSCNGTGIVWVQVAGQSEQLKEEVFMLANKLAVAGEGDAAVAMHKIHNRL